MKRKHKVVSESKNHVLSNSSGRIELWTRESLPFPAGKVSDLPSWVEKTLMPLRGALESLETEQDELIKAEYITQERRADVENVLFYNVRKDTSFKKSSRNGLRFYYEDDTPPEPPEREEYYPHYQSYQLVKKETPFLNGYEKIASYEFALPLSQNPELNDVWWGSVNAEWNLNAERKLKLNRGEALERFAVRVDARYPQLKGEYAVRRVKKVFDGIASAMHFWKNPHEKLVRKVVSHLKVSSKSVREKFQVNEHALLGERHSSPNWNPADDRCIAGELLLTPNTEDEWRFKVEILAVK
ncbi:MAG: hypothetical protein OXE44_00190 [Nitrospinae bacterium]|nr:hypothetical protein [Nitrospinota bacterium]